MLCLYLSAHFFRSPWRSRFVSPKSAEQGARRRVGYLVDWLSNRRAILAWLVLLLIMAAYLYAMVRSDSRGRFAEYYDDTQHVISAQALARGEGYVLPNVVGKPAPKYPIVPDNLPLAAFLGLAVESRLSAKHWMGICRQRHICLPLPWCNLRQPAVLAFSRFRLGAGSLCVLRFPLRFPRPQQPSRLRYTLSSDLSVCSFAC